ncbi:MAG: hypothetical protein U1A27_07225 [Phycisphaerae bacterium]
MRAMALGFMVLGIVPAVEAQLLVNHPPQTPIPTGGGGADSEYLFNGHPFSTFSADDFQVGAPTAVGKVVWWGCYDGDNPPTPESMRIRVYSDLAGLPGAPSGDVTLLNPTRQWTGRIVSFGVGPREYRFEATLDAPISLPAAGRYWLEVSQVGSLESTFIWQYSLTDFTSFAFMTPGSAVWRLSVAAVDLAFQLYVPEPGSAALVLLALGAMRRRTTQAAP